MDPVKVPLNTPSIETFRRLRGVWRSRGYGQVLEIGHNDYWFYEETAISCLPVHSGPLTELTQRYEDLLISPGEQAFSARRATGVTRVGFHRLKRLPATAGDTENRDPDDPEYNFEVFWHSFSEQYALFDLKNVDWNKIYRHFRPHISPNSHPENLYTALTAMLRPLRDGHVRLHSPWGEYSATGQPALYERLEQELEAADDTREVEAYLSELREWLRDVIHEDYLANKVQHGGRHLVEWGRLNHDTGYLNIRAMAGQSGAVGHPARDLATTDTLMQKVLRDLGHLPNLVVDVRGNGGGYDAVALRFAGYLTDRRRLALTKCARWGDRLTRPQSVHVTPAATGTYRGRLFVLTSELTASAAEIFVLALLQRPGLTLIGEPTHGILSDTLERQLPNGWHLTLSNEIYHSFDGQLYEDVGIPPHVHLRFLEHKERLRGRDSILDRALELGAQP